MRLYCLEKRLYYLQLLHFPKMWLEKHGLLDSVSIAVQYLGLFLVYLHVASRVTNCPQCFLPHSSIIKVEIYRSSKAKQTIHHTTINLQSEGIGNALQKPQQRRITKGVLIYTHGYHIDRPFRSMCRRVAAKAIQTASAL